MKIFFDSEFTGLRKDTSLISIGLIAHDNQTFYAEFEDYKKDQVNDWIEKNVISNLSHDHEDLKTFANTVETGTEFIVWHSLMKWLDKFKTIEFISDVCHYDFVLLIDLISAHAGALDMPKNISPVCHDINYDIANYLNISEAEAFNVDRESLLARFEVEIPGKKHNAIYDAKVISEIYKQIQIQRIIKKS